MVTVDQLKLRDQVRGERVIRRLREIGGEGLRRGTLMLVLAALSPALPACVEKWQKPGGTPQEFDAMKASCVARSYARFPPLVRPVQASAGYYTPIETRCSGSGHDVVCRQRGGDYVPPVITTVDDNDNPRDQDTRACFYEHGWQPETK